MTGQIREYLQTRLKLLKYEAIETGTSLAAELITDLLIAFLLLTMFLFLSTALVAWTAKLLHSWVKGAVIVAGLYLLLAICLPLLKRAILNVLIRYLIHKIQTHQKRHEQ